MWLSARRESLDPPKGRSAPLHPPLVQPEVLSGMGADALGEAVGQAQPRPASAIFDRTYFTDVGSTASASPESAASAP